MKQLLIFFLTMLLYASCGTKKEEKESETKFSVTSPLKKDTIITRKYVCQIHSIQHIEIKALEKGYLQKVFVDEGQFVKKGKQCFRLSLLYIRRISIKRRQN